MNAQQAIDWILSLDTPPRPDPSAWSDVEWCNYWRGKRHEVLLEIERLDNIAHTHSWCGHVDRMSGAFDDYEKDPGYHEMGH